MSLIVQKFGGSSVANAERVMNVARIVTDTYKAGNEVVVVVSAQGDTTDDLIAKAREIAAANEHIFLSDLLFRTSFIAHDWMIDGKHDQMIVSEQYMKEHNKPYAPVTPLTNQKMKIKKIKQRGLLETGHP